MVDRPTPSYRWAAFSHWSNLALLTSGGLAGLLIDPSAFYALVPLQVLVLWLAADLPPLRRAVDAKAARKQREAERTYYLDQLYGLRPLPAPGFGDRVKALFVGGDDTDPDERLPRTRETEKYREMRDIVQKLREMVPIAAGRVTAADIERLERVIIGYLRILFACRPLGRAVQESDEAQLSREHAEVATRLARADATLRPVLLERSRLIESQLTRLPKLRATLELLQARAQAIPQQLRNVQSQVLTDPGTEVNAMLNDMIERNDMLADPLADLAADEAVRELLAEPATAAGRGGRMGRVESS